MDEEKIIPPIEFPPEPERPELPPPVQVVDVRFRSGGKVYFFYPDRLKLKEGDHVIIDTARGAEYGVCASDCHSVPACEVIAPLRRVLRVATPEDEKIAAANREKEQRAFEICQKKIAEHKLDMQLVSAECAFDGSKILFFFTAEGRVDFRELVKNLASIFRTRIELRQIGVRDKAKMVGGLGVCGRPFCCSQFLTDFQPVSIKMAKTQNLSLNPTKISGTCGRLMCCLKYEQEAYEDLLKKSPKQESFVDTPDGRGTVSEVCLLRQQVKVRMEDHPETINTYKNDEIAVFRNGKPHKDDPPIPADWAPISSRPHPHRHEEPAEDESMPMLFRKMDEYTAEGASWEPEPAEMPEEKPEEKPKTEGRRPRRRSRRRSSGKKDGAPKQPQGEKQPQGGKEQRPPREGGNRPRGSRPQQQKGQQAQKGQQPRQQKQNQPPKDGAPDGEKKPRSHRPRRRGGRGGKPKEPQQQGQQPKQPPKQEGGNA